MEKHEGLFERFIWAVVFGAITGVFARYASPDGQLTTQMAMIVAIGSVVFGFFRRKVLGPDLFAMLIISVLIFKFIAPLLVGTGTELPQLP
jgi:ABC-type phosphate transport system permease subunit